MKNILQSKGNRWVYEAHLISHALKDLHWRRHLIDHPHAAILESAGITIDPQVQITVLEETPSEIIMVFPYPGHPLGNVHPKHVEHRTKNGFVRKVLEAQLIDTQWSKGRTTFYHSPEHLIMHAKRLLGLNEAYLPADFHVTLKHEDQDHIYLVLPYWGSKAYLDFDVRQVPDVDEKVHKAHKHPKFDYRKGKGPDSPQD
jgi:hypothetical protein